MDATILYSACKLNSYKHIFTSSFFPYACCNNTLVLFFSNFVFETLTLEIKC